jgi:hypothetical protein
MEADLLAAQKAAPTDGQKGKKAAKIPPPPDRSR